MKVLFLRSNSVDPDSRVEKEVETLIREGHEVDIFCWDRESNHPVVKSEKQLFTTVCDIYRIGIEASYGGGFKKNLKPLIRFQIEIVRFLKKYGKRYDVIHACDFDTGLFGYLCKGKRKMVYDMFDYYADSFSVPSILKGLIYQAEDYVANKSDALVLCTEERKNQLRQLKQKNVKIIHNSPMKIEMEDFQLSFSEKTKIAYIGILSEGRMIEEMLEIVSNDNNLELHIAGFGKLESVVESYASNHSNIKYYGKIPYKQTLYIESMCDIMTAIYDPCIRNHRFAAPNKFYEALFLGKPVVMVKGTGMSDVVHKRELGCTIEYNKESLLSAFSNISQNIRKWKKDKNRIQNVYHDYYSWDVMEDRLKSLYEEMQKC